MPHPAVELDDLPDRIDDVPVERAVGRVAELAFGDRQSVRTLDERQVAVLEDRARALPEIGEHPVQEGPAGDPRPRVEGRHGCVPAWCAAPGRRRPERRSRRTRRGCRSHVDQGLLDAHAWRAGVPLHLGLEVTDAVKPVAAGHPQRAVAVDGEVDHRVVAAGAARSVAGAEGTVPSQGGRPGEQDPAPRPLDPGGLARVVHEHAVVEAYEVASAQHALHVVAERSGGAAAAWR